ncbi:MAG: enoyl-CoA hydratase-related protein [Dehalococcoidia bacterium]|nr:enoyl-CoA hydratase-related protein [Dehalococcoidia bacterium]
MGLIYEKKDKIAVLTINRPEALNALDPETMQEMANALTDVRDDPDIWVGILTGSGDRAFSTGADLKKMFGAGGQSTGLPPASFERLFEIFRRFEIWKPFIAAVNGMALGGGTEFALACDIRIAAENASFGLTEPKWSLIPGAGGTQRLPRLIPLGLALEMLLTGKRVDAQEAYRIGLANAVVPLSELMPTAMKMAGTICENGPLAVSAIKEAAIKGLSMPLEYGLRLERLFAILNRFTEDAKEGPLAFAEKRKAQFKGK